MLKEENREAHLTDGILVLGSTLDPPVAVALSCIAFRFLPEQASEQILLHRSAGFREGADCGEFKSNSLNR